MLAVTGWREPISMSGAGKVVDGILRQRPCFFNGYRRLFADIYGADAPARRRHDALAHDVAAAIATIVVAGTIVIGIAVIRLAIAVIAAVITRAGDTRPDGNSRPEAAAAPAASVAPASAMAPTAATVAETAPRLGRLWGRQRDCRDGERRHHHLA